MVRQMLSAANMNKLSQLSVTVLWIEHAIEVYQEFKTYVHSLYLVPYKWKRHGLINGSPLSTRWPFSSLFRECDFRCPCCMLTLRTPKVLRSICMQRNLRVRPLPLGTWKMLRKKSGMFVAHRDVQFSVHKAGLLSEFGPRNVSPQMRPLQLTWDVWLEWSRHPLWVGLSWDDPSHLVVWLNTSFYIISPMLMKDKVVMARPIPFHSQFTILVPQTRELGLHGQFTTLVPQTKQSLYIFNF